MRILASVLLVVLLPISADAQSAPRIGKWSLSSLTMGSGEDPITSGIGIVGGFSKEGSSTISEIAFQNEQGWLAFGRKFGGESLSGHLVGTVGHFQGTPWTGPRFVLSAPLADKVSLGFIVWPGLFAWKPTSFEDEILSQPLVGTYGGTSLSLGSLTLSYSAQKFLNNPWNELPGASYIMKLSPNVSATASGTYNNNASRWMFYLGATWTPPSTKEASVANGK